MLEAHDQWPPFVRINAIRVVFRQNRFREMYATDTDFDRKQTAVPLFVLFGEGMDRFDGGFQLNRALHYARWGYRLRSSGGQTRSREFLRIISIPTSYLRSGNRV